MDEGKVIFDGDTREILSKPETRLIGVGIPKATLLYEMLINDGTKLNSTTPLSSEELTRMVQEALKK
jgi:hypothetical protein